MTPEKAICVCPQCRRTYGVPAKAIGRRARCHMCGKVFRVVETLLPPPTEDDVFCWLCEAQEQDEALAKCSQEADGKWMEGQGGGPRGRHSHELRAA